MSTTAVKDHSYRVGCCHQDVGFADQHPRRSRAHVLSQAEVRSWEAVEDSVVDHRTSAGAGLLSRLEDRDNSPGDRCRIRGKVLRTWQVARLRGHRGHTHA